MHTIVFIHGMFLNPKSWDKWIQHFESIGFNCVAPAWPCHEGDPAALRNDVPEQLGELELTTVIDAMRDAVSQYEQPILIGHSLGGLIVQRLINEGLGCMGVPICSVAPNRMLALDWGFFPQQR